MLSNFSARDHLAEALVGDPSSIPEHSTRRQHWLSGMFRRSASLALQSWRPSKEVPKPRAGKVPKKCFGKCRKKRSGLRAYVVVV